LHEHDRLACTVGPLGDGRSQGLEEVFVHAKELDGLVGLHANLVGHEQLREPRSVDKFDAGIDALRLLAGALGEPRGRDVDAPVTLFPSNAPANSWIFGRWMTWSVAYRLACT